MVKLHINLAIGRQLWAVKPRDFFKISYCHCRSICSGAYDTNKSNSLQYNDLSRFEIHCFRKFVTTCWLLPLTKSVKLVSIKCLVLLMILFLKKFSFPLYILTGKNDLIYHVAWLSKIMKCSHDVITSYYISGDNDPVHCTKIYEHGNSWYQRYQLFSFLFTYCKDAALLQSHSRGTSQSLLVVDQRESYPKRPRCISFCALENTGYVGQNSLFVHIKIFLPLKELLTL